MTSDVPLSLVLVLTMPLTALPSQNQAIVAGGRAAGAVHVRWVRTPSTAAGCGGCSTGCRGATVGGIEQYDVIIFVIVKVPSLVGSISPEASF